MKNKILLLVEIGTVLFTVLVCLPQFHFVVTLLKSLAIQIGLGLFFVGLLALLVQNKRSSIFFLACSMLFLIQTDFWNWSQKQSFSKSSTKEFKIAHLNVLKFNRSHDDLLEGIEGEFEQHDVLSFQEVDDNWNRDLQNKFRSTHPFIIEIPRSDCYGLLVMSRIPIKKQTISYTENIPYIEAQFESDIGNISGVFMHTRAPMSQKKHLLRNKQIKDVASMNNHIDFVVGDFNAVPWDSFVQGMMKELDLNDSRIGFHGTFPKYTPFRIPIDFIFHESSWECSRFEVIDAISSDHLAISGSFIKKEKYENVPTYGRRFVQVD